MQTNILLFRLQIIGILAIVFFLLDVYSWRGVSHLIKKKSPQFKKVIKYLYWGLSGVVILSIALFLLIPVLDKIIWLDVFLKVFALTVGSAKFVIALFVLFEDVLHTIYWVIRKIRGRKKRLDIDSDTPTLPQGAVINRAQFIYQSGVIVAASPVYFFTRGAIKDAHNYKVHRVKILAPNLPDKFNGLKIVQLSDIHSGSFMDHDEVYKGVKKVVEEKPDVFFFTGDMVNVFAYEMNDYLDVFSHIQAPMGMYSTLGNHDYGDYARGWLDENEKARNLQDLKDHHKNLGWQLLNNDHVVLDRMGQKLGIIGVENWGAKARFQKYGDIDKAMKGMPETPFKILLSHDPSHWDAIVRPKHPDIDLTLSGHTHGMQFGIENKLIKFSPAQWMYKQWGGLYTEGNQHLYVNRGYGYLGYPGRIGILPEITVIELVKA